MARRRRTTDAIEEFLTPSDAEKECVWASYNREIPFSETRPLNAAERAQWARIKRKAGRPRTGEGAEPVNVTVERGLLRRADAYAKANGMTRSQLVAQGLAAVLGPATGERGASRSRGRKAS